MSLWAESIDPRGTLVEKYLANRSLELPGEAAGEAIRFHSACPFGAERLPAMVCLVRNIRTNELQSLCRAAIAPEGIAIKSNRKTYRLSLGTIAEGAIKIDPDEHVGLGLCIGEGVETFLSGRQMGLRPVWAAIGTAGIAAFPPLTGVEGLYLFAENDANGASHRAVKACATAWRQAGRTVFIVMPELGSDLNDELREAAIR